MYLVRADTFVAAVCATRASVDTFLQEAGTVGQEMTIERHATTLPCFLIEMSARRRAVFVVVDEAALAVQLRAWVEVDSEPDWYFGTVYSLDGEWWPPRAGTDYMGVLPHVHVERSDLRRFEEHGVEGFVH